MRNFFDLLHARWDQSCLVCVGLDPDYGKIPTFLREQYPVPATALAAFNRAIIEATKAVAGTYKLQSAYYEAWGAPGLEAMAETVAYLRSVAPEVPVMLDAKRADIGTTNNGYVQAIFEQGDFDAVTLHPYLGGEALQPFLEHGSKGTFILCRTSNPGAGEFQDLLIGGEPLYLHVARRVARSWNGHGNCGLVVGGTYPEEARAVRSAVGDKVPFLIPGIGAQGGDLRETVRMARTSDGRGIIINSSRGIIFASSGEDFAEAAGREARLLNDQINEYRQEA